MRLYLASTSPARLTLLRQIGIEPIVVPPEVDEDAAIREAENLSGCSLDAPTTVEYLARLKAEAIPRTLSDGTPLDGFILGGDSAFEFDGVIYGKPHLPEVARERWQRLRGKKGVLHSGHWMIDHRSGRADRENAVGATTSATVEFAADITDTEIDAYIASGEPLKVAGAFTIDGLAAPFIRSISGAPSTVVGMSLPTFRNLCATLGITWTDFWSR